jgi:hypothetical protein
MRLFTSNARNCIILYSMPSSRRELHSGFFFPFLLLICFFPQLYAAETFTLVVQNIEGSANVQRSGKHSWQKVSAGRKLFDNDLVETDFNSRLTLKLPDGGSVMIGSDSRALIAIADKTSRAAGRVEAGFSLLSGGILLSSSGYGRLAVFTGSAVGEIDSGALAAFIETEGRQTGLFNLGGRAFIRGILQQQSRMLPNGRASLVLHGREPFFHIPISFRHVASLKRLFGDSCIENQLRASKIIPLDDKQADGLNGAALSLQESDDSLEAGRQSYDPLFNPSRVYGAIILDDSSIGDRYYTPIHRPTEQSDSAFSVALSGDIGFYENAGRPYATLTPCWRTQSVEAALRLTIARNQDAQTVTGLNSTRGILDKVDHLTLGDVGDSLYCTIGALTDVTLGDGLIVNHFRNDDNNRIFHPLGFAGEVTYANLLDVNMFLADVTDPSLGGVYVKSTPSLYTFGAGYYWDAAPYRHTSDTDDLRFTNPWPSSGVLDTAKGPSGVGIYELDLGVTIAKWYDFEAKMLIDFAQDRLEGVDQGEIYKLPAFELSWPGRTLSFGYMLERGRIISEEFDEFYYSRRSFFQNDTLLTENTSLNRQRLAASAFVAWGANLGRGIDFSGGYSQVFEPDRPFDAVVAGKSNPGPSYDYSFNLRLTINEKAISFIKYASLYACQNHARLFPSSGGLLASWNAEAGFECMTRPLFSSIALQGGGRFFHIDKGPDPDNRLDPGEEVWEFSAGAVWSIP